MKGVNLDNIWIKKTHAGWRVAYDETVCQDCLMAMTY